MHAKQQPLFYELGTVINIFSVPISYDFFAQINLIVDT